MARCGYCFLYRPWHPRHLHSSPTRRSSDLLDRRARLADDAADQPADRAHRLERVEGLGWLRARPCDARAAKEEGDGEVPRSEEHTSELQSLRHLVCRLLLEKKK